MSCSSSRDCSFPRTRDLRPDRGRLRWDRHHQGAPRRSQLMPANHIGVRSRSIPREMPRRHGGRSGHLAFGGAERSLSADLQVPIGHVADTQQFARAMKKPRQRHGVRQVGPEKWWQGPADRQPGEQGRAARGLSRPGRHVRLVRQAARCGASVRRDEAVSMPPPNLEPPCVSLEWVFRTRGNSSDRSPLDAKRRPRGSITLNA